MELINNHLYWIKAKNFSEQCGYFIHPARYTKNWFDVFGSDEGYAVYEVEVLGEVELIVPEYAVGYEP